MAFYDVTVPIHAAMPVYEGDPVVRLERVQSINAGDICNLTRVDAGLHTGTHIDAPVHFIDGAPGVEATPLDALIGLCAVVDATAVEGDIGAAEIAFLAIPAGCERLLLLTRNSTRPALDMFSSDFTAVTADGAAALVARGVRLVGIDSLSIAPFGDPAPTHRRLLEAGIVILEGLDLRDVPPGEYTLLCLPLLIPGADGAPARVLLAS